MTLSSRHIIVLSTVLASVGIGLGIIIGFFAIPQGSKTPQEDLSIVDKLMKEIKAENIRDNSEYLTSQPHIAGRERNEVDLVNWIRDRWTSSGFDSVQVRSYDVLLSYPNQTDSNYVAVVDTNGVESEISQFKELVIDPEQNDPNVVNPFNAYSKSGVPEGELVYVNYGRIEDFLDLNRTYDVETNGKICIARYGKIYRGDKATHAEQYGCIGLILYSDPIDYTVPWAKPYPDSWFLPSTGAQRGSLITGGDPLTPDYPSIASSYRVPEDQLNIPGIPVTPIGYGDAWKYLNKLAGKEVEDHWQGGMNFTYQYGPGFKPEYSNLKMKMSVKTRNEIKAIKNVIGYIKGSVEPDRYVLIGNHRDAWVFGAIDPSSGTAVQTEIARAFGVMLKQGWRPRRTLVFCSWGAEEYGLIGSTEWAEELQKELKSRAVVYVNVDSSLNGNFSLVARGVTSFRNIVYDATKLVKNPVPAEEEEGRASVYDTWVYRDKKVDRDIPNFNSLGSGSDYTAFLHVLGISSIDMKYDFDRSIGVDHYPGYHSVYETFEYVNKFVDPGYKCHQAVAKILAEILRRMSDTAVLPIDACLYAEDLAEKRDALYLDVGDDLRNHDVNLTQNSLAGHMQPTGRMFVMSSLAQHNLASERTSTPALNQVCRSQLDEAITIFADVAGALHGRISKIDSNSYPEVRIVNDQLMQIERSFVNELPLPGPKRFRHVINAPSQHNTYGNTIFPGISDALFDIDADPDQEGRWNEVKKQFSIVVFRILSAAAGMGPVVPE